MYDGDRRTRGARTLANHLASDPWSL